MTKANEQLYLLYKGWILNRIKDIRALIRLQDDLIKTSKNPEVQDVMHRSNQIEQQHIREELIELKKRKRARDA